MRERRRRVAAVSVILAVIPLVGVSIASDTRAATGDLSQYDCYRSVDFNAAGCTKLPGAHGLADPIQTVITADGRFAYVAGATGLVTLERDPGGQLRFKECVTGFRGDGCPQVPELKAKNGAGSVVSIALSPDERFAYVRFGFVVTVFRRDTSSGHLTFDSCLQPSTPVRDLSGEFVPLAACLSVGGLTGGSALAVSANGQRVVAAGGFYTGGDDGVAPHVTVFTRDVNTGRLLWESCFRGTQSTSFACDPLPTLIDVTALAVSQDTRWVYTGGKGGTINVFAHDQSTRRLAYSSCLVGGTDRLTGFHGVCQQLSPNALNGLADLVVSPDNFTLYAASGASGSSVSNEGAHSIAWFNRNTDTNQLTFDGCIRDSSFPADGCAATAAGLEDAHGVAVSPDGKSVYTAASRDSAVDIFSRNATGALTFQGCFEDTETAQAPCARAQDLDRASNLTVSPDGFNVYVGARRNVTVFTRETAGSDGLGTLAPSSLNFGNQILGSKSAPKSVRIFNGGTGPLQVLSTSVTGTDATHFSAEATCVGSLLGPNEFCEFNTYFTPTSLGPKAAKLVVTDNAPTSPHEIDMSGTGTRDPAALDLTPPDTEITGGPKAKTRATTATFTFSSEAGATFACSLDGADFASCTSPATVDGLTPGRHTYRVEAFDAVGNVDPTPAEFEWKVKNKKKRR